MHPLVALRQTFRAAFTVRLDRHDRVPVRAADGPGIDGGRRSMLRHEPQAEPRAAAGRGLDRDGAAMLLGDILHDRETEPRARQMPRAARAPETIEHVW